MKAWGYLVAVSLFASVATWGQGQFYFNNRIEGQLDERIYLPGDAPGTSSVGSPDWSVLLFGGPGGRLVHQLTPLEPPSTGFLGPAGSAGAGYVVEVTPTVPNVPPGEFAAVLLRIAGPDGIMIDQGPFIVGPLGGEGIPIPTLIIPEHSTLLLALLGLGAVIARARGRAVTPSDRKQHS